MITKVIHKSSASHYIVTINTSDCGFWFLTYFASCEEGEVEHNNGVWPNLQFVGCKNYKMWTGHNLNMYKGYPINTQPRGHTSTFESKPTMKLGGWDHWYTQLHLLHIILNSMWSLHDLSQFVCKYMSSDQVHISQQNYIHNSCLLQVYISFISHMYVCIYICSLD